MDIGFPELTDSFLSGQDILYAQFNDIEFYVEDKEQQHFYFNILKKLFPDLKFEKIFPLNGKKNVFDAALVNIGNKKKIYIVDLDFDQILNTVRNFDNLFYLRKYSIENYLFSRYAIYEIIRIKNPKLKDRDIDTLFDLNQILTDASICLKELTCCFIIIKKKQLVHHYYGLNVNRDFDFTTSPPYYRMNFITDYINEVELLLIAKDRRLKLESQKKKLLEHFNSLSNCLSHIPGKHILTFIKDRLQIMGLINQMNVESFSYQLSKDFYSNELDYLKTNVEKYIR
ncbi:DUF4435 domain-containing protein [Aquirufa beregesia]